MVTWAGSTRTSTRRTDRLGMNRIVTGPHPHPMITRETEAEPEGEIGKHRRKGHHRLAVFLEPVGGSTTQGLWIRRLAFSNQAVSWELKSAGEENRRPGRKLVSR